jgi:hypothetical protein
MPGPSPFNISEQQIGAIAYLYGITNSGTTITIAGLDSFEFDSDELTLTWDEKANKDTTGNVQNFTQTNFRYERSLKIFPSGATRAAAATVAGEAAAVTLTSVVISNYKVAAFNGTWRVKSGTKISLKMDDNASIDLNLERYTNATQNTALTGAVITG